MADEIPAAQGTETPSQPAADGGQPKGDVSGVQARINELVAEKHYFKQQAEAQQAQMNELLQQVMQLSQAQQMQAAQAAAAATPNPLAQLDPEERAKYEAVMGTYMQPLQAKLRAQEEQIASMRVQQQAQMFGVPPDVANEAAGYIQSWTKQGFTGWSTQDAITFALGQRAARQMATAAQGRQAHQQFNAGAQTGNFGNAPPPAAAPPPRSRIPDDLSNRDPLQIAAFLDSPDLDIPL